MWELLTSVFDWLRDALDALYRFNIDILVFLGIVLLMAMLASKRTAWLVPLWFVNWNLKSLKERLEEDKQRDQDEQDSLEYFEGELKELKKRRDERRKTLEREYVYFLVIFFAGLFVSIFVVSDQNLISVLVVVLVLYILFQFARTIVWVAHAMKK